LDIEFTVRLVVKSAIDKDALRDDYNDSPLEFIRFLVREEGLQGCTEDDFHILEAHALRESTDANQ
jgi:hypothetical protein